LPTGQYELALSIDRDVPVGAQLIRVDQLAALGTPKQGDAWKSALELDVKPGQNNWSLDRATELFEPARKTTTTPTQPESTEAKPTDTGAPPP